MTSNPDPETRYELSWSHPGQEDKRESITFPSIIMARNNAYWMRRDGKVNVTIWDSKLEEGVGF